jgi:outer membrane protein insertion porin family
MRFYLFLIILLILIIFAIPSVFAQTQDQEIAPESQKLTLTNQEAISPVPQPVSESPESDSATKVSSSGTAEPVAVTAETSAMTKESVPATPEAVPETQKSIVKAVEIKGNRTIGVSTILAKVKTRIGQEYQQVVISDDIKRIYNMGYFSDVNVEREPLDGGDRVIFQVVEKPIVDAITFSKLRYFSPKGLVRKLKTKKGKFLDSKSLNDDIRTLEETYTKKGLTQVKVDVDKKIDELNNKATVHFIIDEGERVKVKRILIDGNIHFVDKRILRIIKTRPAWLFNSGYLKEELLEEDLERIKSFYEREGFIDAKAQYKIEEVNPKSRNIRFSIDEGKQYFVEQISIANNKVLSEAEILAAMFEVRPGGVFSREKLSVDLSNIRTAYFDQGYIFADVRESTSLNPETGKVQIRLDVAEGDLAYINRIKIQGNDRTRDIVIRRELRLYPGDRFDGSKLRRSKERLRNLGYFEDIGYDIEDTDIPDKKDLIVQVKEAKTGSLSFGGGYSTVDQFVGFVEVEQRNFDFTNWPTFTGGGQNITIRAEAGSSRQNSIFSFTEPWLFDYPISGGFDAYLTEREREEDTGYAYDEKRVGGDIRLGKQFTDLITGNFTYRLEDVTIGNFEEEVSADLKAEEGTNTVSSTSFTLVRDARDSAISPTKGFYLSGTTDFAGGILGGDKDFYRFSSRAAYDIPLKWNSVLEFQVRGGIVDAYGDSESVPIFERFFVGGAKTIRGYDERMVGPLDPVTEDPIGGDSFFVGNVELTVPVIEFIKVAAFFDTGNAWEDATDICSGDFKSGFGMGLRVKTPVGPMNLDYGYPLNDIPSEEDRTGKFYFSVSRGF